MPDEDEPTLERQIEELGRRMDVLERVDFYHLSQRLSLLQRELTDLFPASWTRRVDARLAALEKEKVP